MLTQVCPATRSVTGLTDTASMEQFERLVMPHLDAAHNLARWLTRDPADADDVTQEAILRALRFFDGFDGGEDARPWLLAIVRNSCLDWLRRNRPAAMIADGEAVLERLETGGDNPEQAALRQDEGRLVDRAVAALPLEFREVIVLREFEDLSYKEIAVITGIPMGTVMSRLARARALLKGMLVPMAQEVGHGL